MTNIIITTPIAIRRPSLLRLQLPKLAIGRAILAKYPAPSCKPSKWPMWAPFRTTQSKPPVAFDADLEGRDPNW